MPLEAFTWLSYCYYCGKIWIQVEFYAIIYTLSSQINYKLSFGFQGQVGQNLTWNLRGYLPELGHWAEVLCVLTNEKCICLLSMYISEYMLSKLIYRASLCTNSTQTLCVFRSDALSFSLTWSWSAYTCLSLSMVHKLPD